MKKPTLFSALTFTLIGLLVLAAGAFAQDPAPVDPAAPADPAFVGDPDVTISDVTANSEAYYGQRLTLDGNVDELVNIRMFIIGEAGLLGANQLLVINNTGQEFPFGLTRDVTVRVTGTIFPHYTDGGFDQVWSMVNTEPMMRQDPAVSETPMADPAMQPQHGEMMGRAFWQADDYGFAARVVEARFGNFTILYLDSMDAITILEENL
ncbi:MAG: hypothetical protein SNJ59_08250 [Aggregatilineales bacterium]